MKNINHRSAFVSLVSVLILGAVGLSISVYIILFSLASSKNSLSLAQSAQSRMLANACAESALEQIREVPAFVGTANLTLGGGDCSYTVSNTGGETRNVIVVSAVSGVVRRLTLTVTAINPLIITSLWQEIP